MKKYLLLALVTFFTMSCSNNGSDETPEEITYPDNEGDFITLASVISDEGDTVRNYYLQHNGQLYTGYSRYDRNDQGEFVLFQHVEFTYDDGGRMLLAEFFYDDARTRPVESKFEYTWGPDSYTFQRWALNNGNYESQGSETHLYNNPQTGYRLVQHDALGDYIYGFQDGNHVGYGYLNADQGEVEFDGRRWDFRVDFGFDDQPNALSDQALHFMFGGRGLQGSFNANNYNTYYYPDSDRKEEWTFVYGGGKWRGIEYPSGAKRVMQYIPIED